MRYNFERLEFRLFVALYVCGVSACLPLRLVGLIRTPEIFQSRNSLFKSMCKLKKMKEFIGIFSKCFTEFTACIRNQEAT